MFNMNIIWSMVKLIQISIWLMKKCMEFLSYLCAQSATNHNGQGRSLAMPRRWGLQGATHGQHTLLDTALPKGTPRHGPFIGARSAKRPNLTIKNDHVLLYLYDKKPQSPTQVLFFVYIKTTQGQSKITLKNSS